MTFIADVFLNLRTTEKQWLKSHVSEDPSTSNMVNAPKLC